MRQPITKSGIWHWDARREANPSHPVALPERLSPEDLKVKLEQDSVAANSGLAEEAYGYGSLRPYQEERFGRSSRRWGRAARYPDLDGDRRRQDAHLHCAHVSPAQAQAFSPHPLPGGPHGLGRPDDRRSGDDGVGGFYKFSQIYRGAELDQRLPEPEDQVQVATVRAPARSICLNRPT